MTEGATASIPEEATGNQRLAILLAMAMFVLVVDTSLRCGPVRPRHGRHRAGHPGVAGRRRSRRGAAGDQRDRPGGVGYWLGRRKRQGKPTLLDPELFSSKGFRFGISQQMLQQISLGGLMIALLPIVPRADSGWWLVVPLVIAGSGLGLLVSQLNNYTLAPISEERVSEAAGVNSAGGSFGLSFGLAFAGAIMLATLSIAFTDMAEASTVLAPDEIVGINTHARLLALQVALLVPILAGLIGLFTSFRMMRLPDPQPSGSVEGMALG
jgi:hypothetical protein